MRLFFPRGPPYDFVTGNGEQKAVTNEQVEAGDRRENASNVQCSLVSREDGYDRSGRKQYQDHAEANRTVQPKGRYLQSKSARI